MNYFAGIDIGSTTIKIALSDEDGCLAAYVDFPTGSHFHQNAKTAFTGLLDRECISPEKVSYIIATGYGRKLYREADDIISEITANSIGARRIGSGQGEIRTIINIGGQDLKVISLDTDGHVKNFVMMHSCYSSSTLSCIAGSFRLLSAASSLYVNVNKTVFFIPLYATSSAQAFKGSIGSL